MNNCKLIFSVILLLFFSCSSDESQMETPKDSPIDNPIDEEQEVVESFSVSSLSDDYVIEGNTLKIQGNNFKKDDSVVNVYFNDVSFEVVPDSDTQISIVISDEIDEGFNNVSVGIGNELSETLPIYVHHKGWTKVVISGAYNVQKSVVFDSTYDIIMLSNKDTSSSVSFYGELVKIILTPFGYQIEDLGDFNNNLGNNSFEMYDGETVVISSVKGTVFSDDYFTSFTEYPSPVALFDNYISFIDKQTFFISGSQGDDVYVSSMTNESNKKEAPEFIKKNGSFRATFNSVDKSSDNVFYKLGFMYDDNLFKRNLILSSDGEYASQWEVKDSITVHDKVYMLDPKFVDSDLILSSAEGDLYKTNDLCLTWELVENGVTSIFPKNETQWYGLKSDGIYSTQDAGLTWVKQIEIDGDLFDISFSDTKVVVSTSLGVYLKL